MSMLFSNEIKPQILNELKNTIDNLQVITAYCKKSAIEFIQNNITNPIENKRLMVRFTFDDIVSGASDLDVYEFCKAQGWQMYLRFDMHAKTYIFDKKRCIIGSANLTSRGLDLKSTSNYEMATLTVMVPNDIQRIDSLFNNAILMNDEIYQKMLYSVSGQQLSRQHSRKNWSDDILSLFVPDISVLFTYDFPNCHSPKNLTRGALDFLSIPDTSSFEDIRVAFRWSKAYLWLCDILKQAPNNELYFGSMSEKLHNILVNDPRPFRKEVKELQQYLLNWTIELDMEHITVDRPNHSQRIKYVNQSCLSVSVGTNFIHTL